MRCHLLLCATLAVGCGSSNTPAPSQPLAGTQAAPAGTSSDEASPAAPLSKQTEAAGLPTACDGASDSCVMPKPFVKRMCAGVWPDLALVLFTKGTPWRRAYVSVKQADAFNGFGGPSTEEKLLFDEEVLIIGERKPDMGGMSVSGAGASYDFLRWDGSCATLSAQEVRLQRPPKPGHAKVPWRNLDDPTQNALLKDDKLAKVAAERKKECKGATMGEVSAKCEKADRLLNDLVVEAVRGGASLPEPSRLP